MKLILSTFLTLLVSSVLGLDGDRSLAFRAPQSTQGIAVPWSRYRLWENLNSDVKTAAETLTYTETSWNLLGTLDDVESLNFDALEEAPQSLEIDLGFLDQKEWNCCVNHWTFYDWGDFSEGIQPYWEALGWTEDSWNGAEDPPASDEAPQMTSSLSSLLRQKKRLPKNSVTLQRSGTE